MKKAGSIGSAFFAHFKWLSLILGGASKCVIVGAFNALPMPSSSKEDVKYFLFVHVVKAENG